MTIIHPLRAFRPKDEFIAQVVSAPFEVLDRAAARKAANANPFSILHVIRSEIDFGDDVNIDSDEVIGHARECFSTLLNKGVLIEERETAFYLYRLSSPSHTQTGIVGRCALDEYAGGRIKRHEATRPEREIHCAKLMLSVGAQASPIFLTYREISEITELMDREAKNSPLVDFLVDDGVRHTVWKITDANHVTELIAKIPTVYVADGHHRLASAFRCRESLRRENPDHSGVEDYNFILSALFPHTQLRILPFHRAVRKLGFGKEEILRSLMKDWQVVAGGGAIPQQKGSFGMYLEGTWYRLLSLRTYETPENPVAMTDARVLQTRVLEQVFGVMDPRIDENLDFIPGTTPIQALEKLVDSGKAACVITLFPTTVEELMAVADADMVMDPKSTWFEPKHRSGLIIYRFL